MTMEKRYYCPVCAHELELHEVPVNTRMRLLREERGLLVKDMAAKLGVSHARISQLENGHREISLAMAVRVTKVLGITLDELAGGVL